MIGEIKRIQAQLEKAGELTSAAYLQMAIDALSGSDESDTSGKTERAQTSKDQALRPARSSI